MRLKHSRVFALLSSRLTALPLAAIPLVGILAGAPVAMCEETASAESPYPVVFEEDFENGIERWEIVDPKSWAIQEHGLGKSLAITQRESDYKPKVRSPLHIALIKGVELESFVLTFKVKSTKNTGNHRDCCVFFNYQDPTHFYYVHTGAKPDPHSGQIFIVNDAPRTALTENETGVPWTDDWHDVKVVRDFDHGSIDIFFDDMTTPILSTHDKTFGKGRIGLGSFDDMDAFDQIELRKGAPAH
ncbi:hypothetical protein [Neorhodopirellula lusitana]|uniref:hypothetical protein n=1 Tax=Neorhodopirellula lusitana TaxID=445327 RepID=UPI00384D69BE